MLGQNLVNHTSWFDPGESLVQALEGIGEASVINPKQMQNGGIQVVDVDRITDNVVTELVGFPVYHTTANTSAGHPN
jgi:hypothetical protein